MAGQFLDYTGLAVFKDLLFNLINNKLATKQDKGDYVTTNNLNNKLELYISKDYLDKIDINSKRDRDPSKPSYGL